MTISKVLEIIDGRIERTKVRQKRAFDAGSHKVVLACDIQRQALKQLKNQIIKECPECS